MVRRRGLQYSIEVKDGFSANLDILAAKLGIVQQQFNLLGTGLANFATTARTSGAPLKEINREVGTGRGITRKATRDYGRLAVALRAVRREANSAAAALAKVNTQTRAFSASRNAGTALATGFRGASRQVGATNKELAKTETFLDRALRVGVRVFAIFFAFRAFKVAAGGLFEAVRQGVQFNAQIERSTLSIQSLISSFNQAVDSQGNLVTGQEKFAAAAELSRKTVDKLRVAGLSTAATFEELLFAFQTAFAPGSSAGFNIDQIEKLTILISQAATALGLEQNQLAEEIRSLFQATPSARTTRLAVLFEQGELQEARQQGTLEFFQLLTQRLEQFGRAGQESLGTFTTLVVNLKDGVRQLLGEALGGFFTNLVETLRSANTLIFGVREGADKININPDALSVVEQLNASLNVLLEQVKSTVKELGFGGIGDALTSSIFLIEKAISLLLSSFFLITDTFVRIEQILIPVVKLFDVLGDALSSVDDTLSGTFGISIKDTVADLAAWAVALLVVTKTIGGFRVVLGALVKFVAPAFVALKSLFATLGAAGAFTGAGAGVGTVAAAFGALLATVSGVAVAAGLLIKLFTEFGNDILPEGVKQLEIGGRKISEWITLADDFFDNLIDGFFAFGSIASREVLTLFAKAQVLGKQFTLRFIKFFVDQVNKVPILGGQFDGLSKVSELIESSIRNQANEIEKLNQELNSYRRSVLQSFNASEQERDSRKANLDLLRQERLETQGLVGELKDLFSPGEGGALFGPTLRSVKEAQDTIRQLSEEAEKADRKLRFKSLVEGFEGLNSSLGNFVTDALIEVGEPIENIREQLQEFEDVALSILEEFASGRGSDELFQSFDLALENIKSAELTIQELQDAAINKGRQRFVEFIQQENAKSVSAAKRATVELDAEEELLGIRREFLNRFIPAEKAASALRLAQTLASQREERRLLDLNIQSLEAEKKNAKEGDGKKILEERIVAFKAQQLLLDRRIGNQIQTNLVATEESFASLSRELGDINADLSRQELLADLPVQISEVGEELRNIESEIRQTFSGRRRDLEEFSEALFAAFKLAPEEFGDTILDTFIALEDQIASLSGSEQEALEANFALYAANLNRRTTLENEAAQDRINLLRQINEIESGVGFSTLRGQRAEYEKQVATLQQQFDILSRLSNRRIADLRDYQAQTIDVGKRLAIESAILAIYSEQTLAAQELDGALAQLNSREALRQEALTEKGAFAQFVQQFQDELENRGQLILDLAQTVKDGITDVLGGALTDALFRDENSLAERAQTLAEQIVQIFVNEFIKRKILANLFDFFDSPASGGGGTPASPFKGGLIGGSGRLQRPSLAHQEAKGYFGGGRPRGLHPSDTIPAWLAKGEFVQPRKTVQKYGVQFMEALRRGVLDPIDVRSLLSGKVAGLTSVPGGRQAATLPSLGFNDGGLVRAVSARTGNNRGSGNGVTILNVYDPDQLPAMLASGSGRDTIVNIVDARLSQKGV